MAEIVRRFRYELRVEWWNPEIIWCVEPEGKPNLRYLDLYGFGIGSDENGGVPPEPRYDYPAETEA
uniref:Uncharacterized protein n=1 Tax=mine drainage metagenome TaxID=410659 RepID=E6QGL9_9ZZZZ